MPQDSQAQNKSPIYIYIAGRGHSGSTLLTLLLARHPDVAAVGELSLLSLQIARDESTRWVGRCSCGERPMNCPVWGQALAEVGLEEGVDIGQRPFSWRVSDVGMEEEHRRFAPLHVPYVWLRNRFWRVVRYLHYLLPMGLGKLVGLYKPQKQWARNRSTLVSRLASICRVSAIVDASKDPLDMMDVYYNATVPVKVIFLTRDPCGNVWSALKRIKARVSRNVAISTASKEWVRSNARTWRLVQDIDPADRMHLKYEDFCRRPEETMNELFRFVGLKEFDVVNGSSGEGGPGHTIGGNKIRFSSEKLSIREDKAWKENLSAEEIETIHRISASLAQELGHEQ